MNYDRATNPLAPHSYQHDFVPGEYLVVQPKKGISVTFRIRPNHGKKSALSDAKKRGFKPLYIINARLKDGIKMTDKASKAVLDEIFQAPFSRIGEACPNPAASQ
jgi:hypothetical protein